MKKAIVFLFITFIGFHSIAQNKLDSLWNVWNDESQANNNRIDALSKIIWSDYLFSMPDSGFYYGSLIYDFAKSKNEKQGMLNALNIQAISLTIRGMNKKALDLYNRAEIIALEVGQPESLSKILCNKGNVLIDLYAFDEAKLNFKKCIKICEETGIQKGIGSALNSIGIIYQKQSNYKLALENFEKSLEYFVKFGQNRNVANTYHKIGEVQHVLGNNELAFDYLLNSLTIRKELNDKIGEVESLLFIGEYYNDLGNYDNALSYFNESFAISEEVHDSTGIANSLNKIGRLYHNQGNFEEALDVYRKSLSVMKNFNNRKDVLSSTICFMGETLSKMKMSDNALKQYNESLEIRLEINDKKGIAECYNNIATVYFQIENPKLALDYHLKSLEIKREIGFLKGEAISLYHIGEVYSYRKDYVESLANFKAALKIFKKLNIKNRIANVHFTIGYLEEEQQRFNNAIHSYNKAKSIQTEIGDLYGLSRTLKNLYKNLRRTNNSIDALLNYEEYISVKDSLAKIDGIEKEKERFIHEKYLLKIQADSIVSANEIKIQQEKVYTKDAENEKLTQQKYFLFGVISLAFIFGGFIFNRFRITNRQKGIIESQKEQVEEKNDEILDSIQYARRLQEATLPPERIVNEYLSDFFILYRPKDIVSGDFYWVEKLNDWTYFAVADCTGHGVPGALVSVVCSSALSKALIEENIKEPSEILNRTRELIIERFERSENEIMDGMDISLCAYQDQSGILKWAGAHNPLWIIRKNSQEIESLKGDSQPVGIYPVNEAFTAHEVQLNKGDSIYLLTDGIVDQFGGLKGKKYKSANFKRFLISISDNDMEIQKQLINTEFDEWRGSLAQIDDVCVMGIRI